jgi:hypothetical protein
MKILPNRNSQLLHVTHNSNDLAEWKLGREEVIGVESLQREELAERRGWWRSALEETDEI